MVHLRMSRIVFAAKQLNDIAHKRTIICRQLFTGHVVGSRPMKRKKHLHRMIVIFLKEHISGSVAVLVGQKNVVRLNHGRISCVSRKHCMVP